MKKDNLQRFFKAVGETDLLTREEEVELSKRIEKGDMRARDQMIRANIRLAISIAKKYANKGADLEDLGLTIHPHPTFVETISLAAQVAEGTVTDL